MHVWPKFDNCSKEAEENSCFNRIPNPLAYAQCFCGVPRVLHGNNHLNNLNCIAYVLT